KFCSCIFSLASSVIRAAGLWTRPACLDSRADSASRTEVALHNCPLRFCRFDHVFKYLIDDVLLKNPQIAITVQILFERLQLQTELLWHVPNGDHTEIGKAGLGTHRGKLRYVDDDLIGRKLVWPGLNIRKAEVQT